MTDQVVFISCIFAIVTLLGWWVTRLLLDTEYSRLRQRLRGDSTDAPADSPAAIASSLLLRVGQAASTPFMPKSREAQSAIRRQLGQAGIYAPSAVRLVIGSKVLLLVVGIMGGYFAGATLGNIPLGASLGGLLAYVLPTLWLKLQIRDNQKALQRGLPDALDLLVVCIEAGLTIDAALQRVGQELSLAHPRLARELEITHMETRIGLPRSDAMRNLGLRTGSPALQAVSTMLIQAERFGTSIAAALRVQADTLRTERQHAAEELAAKASVKLTFPVVLFIFPAVLIVLGGPAIIGLLKSSLLGQ
ncbi:MAG TPA: type II secretion system F family protein [Tepidisphaeraceae bacterium]|nr:type II secretion system F family protein [Tepidisphaeraceae bacterium]